MSGRIFILEGSVGAGKSSLAKATMDHCKALFDDDTRVAVVRESVNELFLKRCIADPKRHALPFQICMARDRIQAMELAREYASDGFMVLVDRGLPGDITFALMHHAGGNIDDEDLRLYFSHLLHGMPFFVPHSFVGGEDGWRALQRECNALNPVDVHCEQTLCHRHDASPPPPEVIVYLHVTPAQARGRVERRGNAAEVSGYDEQYFAALHDQYEKTMKIFEKEWGSDRVVRYEYGAAATAGAVDANGLPTLDTCTAVWQHVFDSIK